MLRADPKATQPSTATAVVTVDPVGDEHRTLFPRLLDRASHVIAVRRGSALVDCELFITNAADVHDLRTRARQFANAWGFPYSEPCGWCGINCAPTTRLAHEQLFRGSESNVRARWAA